MQVPGEEKADVYPSAMRERKVRAQSRISFEPPDGELVYPSGGEGLVSDVGLSVMGSIVLSCSLKHSSEDSGGENITKICATSTEDICTARMKSCVSCALDKQHNRVFDPGGLTSTTKAASSGVLCRTVYRMHL